MQTRSSDMTIRKAEAVIAYVMGVDPKDVRIGVGEEREGGGVLVVGAKDAQMTRLQLAITKPGIDLDVTKAQADILAALNRLDPVRRVAQTVTDEQLTVDTVAKLKATAQGTSLNPRLLDWPGFDPEIEKQDWGIKDHAVEWVRDSAYGVEFSLRVPTRKDEDPKPMLEKVEKNIQGRLADIKTMLEGRMVKYLTQNLKQEGKPEAEIAEAVTKAKEAFAKLDVAVNIKHSGVEIALRSPEQTEAVKTSKDRFSEPDNADALRASNPLCSLKTMVTDKEKEANPHAAPQLHKALARSFLHGGNKDAAMEVFPLIAGRADIKTAIAKEIKAAIVAHPEKAAAFNEVLSSNLFKNHWSSGSKDQDAALPKPEFAKRIDESDTMRVTLNLPVEKVRATLEGLASYARTTDEAAKAAPPANVVAAKDCVPGMVKPAAGMEMMT